MGFHDGAGMNPISTRPHHCLAAVLAALSLSLATPAAATTFTYSGAEVTFTVPTTGLYSFTADGAQGGAGSECTYTSGCTGFGVYTAPPGGLGAQVAGSITLTAGDTIDIIVGGQGGAGQNTAGSGGGGGGGTFVYDATTSTLLLAAGGGGGGAGAFSGLAVGLPGLTTTAGGDSSGTNAGLGGLLGAGGSAGYGGAGAGYLTDGGNAGSGNGNATGGLAFSDTSLAGTGGSGGTATRGSGGAGGFGGGGGGAINGLLGGGGGGGYSGGGGGGRPVSSTTGGGGGGGSFIIATASGIALSSGVNSGDGQLVITAQSSAIIPEPEAAGLLGVGLLALFTLRRNRRS